jgi:hypothetical protein
MAYAMTYATTSEVILQAGFHAGKSQARTQLIFRHVERLIRYFFMFFWTDPQK